MVNQMDKSFESVIDDIEKLHPEELLKKLSNKWSLDFYSKEFALKLDESNIWPTYRDRFNYPKNKTLPKSK